MMTKTECLRNMLLSMFTQNEIITSPWGVFQKADYGHTRVSLRVSNRTTNFHSNNYIYWSLQLIKQTQCLTFT